MSEANLIHADLNNTAIILPVFNSAHHLKKLIPALIRYFPQNQIFAVNDGSSDNSSEICRSFRINLIDFELNQGKGAALYAGLKEASSNGYLYAFSMDSDEQHLPDHIPRFIKAQNDSNAGLVIGKRDYDPFLMPRHRICSNKITSFIVSITARQKIADSQCGYRLYDLNSLENFEPTTMRYQFETEILLHYAKAKILISSTPIKTVYADETSHINHLRDIWNFMELILRYWFKLT